MEDDGYNYGSEVNVNLEDDGYGEEYEEGEIYLIKE